MGSKNKNSWLAKHAKSSAALISLGIRINHTCGCIIRSGNCDSERRAKV